MEKIVLTGFRSEESEELLEKLIALGFSKTVVKDEEEIIIYSASSKRTCLQEEIDKMDRKEFIEEINRLISEYEIHFLRCCDASPRYVSVIFEDEYNDETYEAKFESIYFYDETHTRLVPDVELEDEYGDPCSIEELICNKLNYDSPFYASDIQRVFSYVSKIDLKGE